MLISHLATLTYKRDIVLWLLFTADNTRPPIGFIIYSVRRTYNDSVAVVIRKKKRTITDLINQESVVLVCYILI